MSIKKYSLLTLLIYALAYFIPGLVPSASGQILMTTMTYVLGAILLILLYLKQTERLSFESKETAWWVWVLIGIFGIFAAILLQNFVMNLEQLFGQEVASENTANALAIVMQRPLFAIAIMIGAPIMEELVFRRAIIGFLETKMNTWIAMCISSFLFALVHLDGHLLLYFSLGFFFSCLYRLTGRIWTSMLTHAGMNSLVVIVNLLVLPLINQ